jgi:hypothetical protein
VLEHRDVRAALRAKLLTLQVCTTGSTTLAATATGYTRASGSFLTDGFAPGMEVTPDGFTQTATAVIKAVTALTIAVVGSRTVEASASGRTLTVGLPASRAWENVEYTPTTGVPYVVEEYIPGPMRQVTLGSQGEMEVLPIYAPKVYVPSGLGSGAADAYADALLLWFAPMVSVTIPNGTLRVRSDVAPYRGQLLQNSPGFAVVPVTIPLRLRTAATPNPEGDAEDWGSVTDTVTTLSDLGVL